MIKNERDSKIRKLDNEYRDKTEVVYKYVGGNHTYCTSCKRNCHENCDCFGSFLNRCNVFSVFGGCEECGHDKSCHSLHSSYKYVTETTSVKVNNYDQIRRVEAKYWNDYHRINDEYNKKMDEKNQRQSELEYLNNQKSQLESQKNSYINDKNIVDENIKTKMNNLKSIIIDLMDISKKINNIAMNQYHFDIENEYIETLIAQMMESNDKNDQIKKLKENKKYNQIFQELNKLSLEELKENDDILWNELKKLSNFYSLINN
jgi:hypothetical protein